MSDSDSSENGRKLHTYKQEKYSKQEIRSDKELVKYESKYSRKHKKHKSKDKKRKKKKKNRNSSCSSDKSDSEDSEVWVEKSSVPTAQERQVYPGNSSEKLQHDEWMSASCLVPTLSKEEIKEKLGTRNKRREKEEEKKCSIEALGQTDRELNPYWRDGGKGLPQENISSSIPFAEKTVGDRGVDWLRKALQRSKEQAEEQGRSLEDVVGERWGSLEKLQSMIAEAEHNERKVKSNYYSHRNDRRKQRQDDVRWKGDTQSSEGRREILRNSLRKPDETPSGSKSSHHGSQNQSDYYREPHKHFTSFKSSSRVQGWKKKEIAKPPEIICNDEEEKVIKQENFNIKEEKAREPECEILTDKQMNELAAKLIKAELLGNETQIQKLKSQLEAARAAKKKSETSFCRDKDNLEEVVILSHTDSKGNARPLTQPSQHAEPSGGRRRKQKAETHESGKRVRYFADDDKYSLREMFEREKLSTVEDQNEEFIKMAGKVHRGDDMDDVFSEKISVKKREGQDDAKARAKAISEHRRTERSLENCVRCFDSNSMLKHLMIALGSKVYLSLPSHASLTEGHCLIVPIHHITCATQMDEDVWAEVLEFRKALTSMFLAQDMDVVFFELAVNFKNFPHMAIECIPMPKETGDMAPIYFKKSILECEMEWSNNKKVVDLRQKDVRKSVPKGLPYFFVDFGMEGGFAHVIEEERTFPRNFAQEIIGGMLDLDHSLWRKPRKENFELQCKKVLQFTTWWKPFDFTEKNNDSD